MFTIKWRWCDTPFSHNLHKHSIWYDNNSELWECKNIDDSRNWGQDDDNFNFVTPFHSSPLSLTFRNVQHVDIRVTNVEIPAADTTYYCKIQKLHGTEKKRHIVGESIMLEKCEDWNLMTWKFLIELLNRIRANYHEWRVCSSHGSFPLWSTARHRHSSIRRCMWWYSNGSKNV